MSDLPDQEHSKPEDPADATEPVGVEDAAVTDGRGTGLPKVPPFARGATSPTDTTETAPLDLPTPRQRPGASAGGPGLPPADPVAADPAGSDPGEPGTDSAPTVALPAGDAADRAAGASGADGAAADDTGTLRVPRDPKSRLALVTLLFAIVAFGLNLLSVTTATRLSALDEATHVDYAYRLSSGELTYLGQPLSQYTLDQWACRGQANIRNLPACGSGKPYSSFPGDGLQYNAYHPPLYYAITGMGARLMAAVTGQDFVTMARVIGGLWLFLGMLALYLTLRYWRVGWGWAMGGALMLPLIPVLLHASTIVTNDAAVPLAGAAALFVLARHVVYRNYGWIVPVLFTVLVTSTKTISAAALGAVGIVLVILGIARWRAEGTRTGLKLIRNGVLMGVALAVVHFGWQYLQNGRAVADYVSPVLGVNTKKIVGLPFSEWIPTLFTGAELGDNYYLDPYVNNAYLQGWVALITTLIAAAGFVGIALFDRGTPHWIAAGTLLVGVLFYPLAVQLQTYLRDYYFPGVTTRYGMSILPVAIAVLVMIAERKRLRITSWVLLLGGGVAVGSATLGLLQ